MAQAQDEVLELDVAERELEGARRLTGRAAGENPVGAALPALQPDLQLVVVVDLNRNGPTYFSSV
jgi:hypothetical protein